MQYSENVNISLDAIRVNKLRSALTLLGIIIGVMTIIGMQSLITGLRKNINQQISALGSNVFQVQKWPAIGTAGTNWEKYRNRENITIENYEFVKEKVPAARAVGAELWQQGVEVRSRDEKTLPVMSVCGGTPAFLICNGFEIADGRFLFEHDLMYNGRVAVIGLDIVNKLFPYENPIGREIKLQGQPFEVIGVFTERGSRFGNSLDRYAVIPIGSFVRLYGKKRSVRITVQALSTSLYDKAMEQTIGALRISRKVSPGEENDFDIYSNDTVMEFFDNLTRMVRIVAIAIASISLIVAGVGIMNIMLVSVTERTREIGIRKSIGAKRGDILGQFLIEAVVLCELGGIIGTLMGLGIARLISMFTPVPAAVPMIWVIMALLFCSIVGVVFGLYPASKAARLDPIVALRYE